MRIYHEQQESLLCGQHCLNNLLQGPVFSAPDLADIALSLDRTERAIASGDRPPLESSNVDEMGNFSIQVLRNALQIYNVALISWSSSDESGSDPLQEQLGFIINRQSHWFAIRRINGKWWNLNSSQEKPEIISTFHLAAFLSQLRADNYYVFIARGEPSVDPDAQSSGSKASGCWHEETDLVGGKADPALVPFSGAGNKLGGAGAEVLTGDVFEDDLARAIAMSLSSPADAASSALSAKEEMRAKRLAALDHR